MIEAPHGEDIWAAQGPNDWVCITTNCTLRKDGRLVMGGGIALEAAQRFPWLPLALGEDVKRNGANVVTHTIGRTIAFPVKYDVAHPADLELIEMSTARLAYMVLKHRVFFPSLPERILIPRPGCGLGNRTWEEVRPILERHLVGDRYVIFSK